MQGWHITTCHTRNGQLRFLHYVTSFLPEKSVFDRTLKCLIVSNCEQMKTTNVLRSKLENTCLEPMNRPISMHVSKQTVWESVSIERYFSYSDAMIMSIYFAYWVGTISSYSYRISFWFSDLWPVLMQALGIYQLFPHRSYNTALVNHQDINVNNWHEFRHIVLGDGKIK